MPESHCVLGGHDGFSYLPSQAHITSPKVFQPPQETFAFSWLAHPLTRMIVKIKAENIIFLSIIANYETNENI